MGSCASASNVAPHPPPSSEEVARNQEVRVEIEHSRAEQAKVHQLLLLGPGNSGKSTFFRQLEAIHGKEMDEAQRSQYRQYIHQSTIDQMQNLLEMALDVDPLAEQDEKNEREDGDEDNEEDGDEEEVPLPRKPLEFDADTKIAADYIGSLPRDQPITTRIAQCIKTLWSNADMKHVFENRVNLSVVDSSPYFWENVDRLSADAYIPTYQDILLARMPTTGIRETKFSIGKESFAVFDVGGQRSERAKWIHCFDQVHGLMFVIGSSCYDQKLFEDSHKNAMEEGLELWEEILDSQYFTNQRTSLILFFNKSDLFKKKILRKPFNVCFSDYKGDPHDFDECMDYLRDLFLDKIKSDDVHKQIYTHVTCATDRECVKKVFYDTQHHVVLHAMTQNGIID